MRCIAATTGTPAHTVDSKRTRPGARGPPPRRLKTSSDDANGFLFAEAARSVEPGSAHCSSAGIVASVAVQSTRMQPGWSAPARAATDARKSAELCSDGRAATSSGGDESSASLPPPALYSISRSSAASDNSPEEPGRSTPDESHAPTAVNRSPYRSQCSARPVRTARSSAEPTPPAPKRTKGTLRILSLEGMAWGEFAEAREPDGGGDDGGEEEADDGEEEADAEMRVRPRSPTRRDFRCQQPRDAGGGGARGECRLIELPADVLGLVLYQLTLAHDIAAVAPTCHALCALQRWREVRPLRRLRRSPGMNPCGRGGGSDGQHHHRIG